MTRYEPGLCDNIGPILQRRSLTSYGDFPTIAHLRTRSARYPTGTITMPRSHVSIARFYDWSDDLGECVSVSRLYRNLANIPRDFGDKARSRNMQWCSNGVRVTPGRMFARDKGALTKGEREIIEGIYRNRGDTRDSTKSDIQVKSHKEAWLVGKQVGKVNSTSEDQSEFKVPDSLFTGARQAFQSSGQTSKVPCYFCAKENKASTNVEAQQGCNNHDDWLDERPTAPPSTPDKLLPKRHRVPPINNGQGAVLVEDDIQPSFRDSQPSARRVRVNVYLPIMPAEQTEDELKSCMLHGKSALTKERPLSHSDFKQRQQKKGASKGGSISNGNEIRSYDSRGIIQRSKRYRSPQSSPTEGKLWPLNSEVSE